MANILWACWDGGGNLTPSIGIAHLPSGTSSLTGSPGNGPTSS